MTSEEKEDRILELLDDILYGEKLIQQGTPREELQPQFDEIEKELNKLTGVKGTKKYINKKYGNSNK